MASGQWMVAIGGIAPATTLEQQTQVGQVLLHSYGISDANAQVLRALNLDGSFLVQTPDIATPTEVANELQVLPGFGGIQPVTQDIPGVAEWLAKFGNVPGNTRADQLPYIQGLLHDAGLDVLGITAVEHVGVDGCVILQSSSADDLGVLQNALEAVPGFASVESYGPDESPADRSIYVPNSPANENDGGAVNITAPVTDSMTTLTATPQGTLGGSSAGPSLLQTGMGFDGINRTNTSAVSPPDTTGAVGPSSYIEPLNTSLAIYSKTTGTTIPGGGITTFSTFFAPLGTSGVSFSDPIIVYNDVTQQFAVGILDFHVSGGTTPTPTDCRLDFAISKTSNPTLASTDWNFFRYNTNDGIGATFDFSDYPKIGYNADGYVVSFNMFPNLSSFDHTSVLGIDNNGTGTGMREMPYGFTNFTLAPASMHGATAGAPMWFLGDGHTGGGGSSINVIRLDNPFSTTAVVTSPFPIAVPSFGSTPNARQPGGTLGGLSGSSHPDNTSLGTRFYFSAWRTVGGVAHLVSAHAIGNGTGVSTRWYDFTITNGTPTLLQQGNVNPNIATTDTYFPSVDINPGGSIGMNYSESGSSEYMSMYVTGRTPSDTAGTMETPVLAKTNAAVLNALGRAGDYSFTTVDPTDGSFWAANEYAASFASPNWATWIQRFTFGSLAVSSSAPANGAIVSLVPSSYVINFSDAVDPASLLPSALTVNSLPANGVSLSTDDKTAMFTFTTSPVTTQGLQAMAMAAGSATRLSDPTNALTAFNATFRYDAVLLAVASTNPASGGSFTLPGPFTYDVNFNEPLLSSAVTTGSLVLSGIAGATVSNVALLNGNMTARYTLDNITSGGTLNVNIAAGAVTDQYGNSGTAFSASYYVDIGTTAFPVPLTSTSPSGSLIYRNSSSLGIINPDLNPNTFTLAVDPGQTISVLVTPTSSTLQPTVQLLDANDTVIGTATAAAANQSALLQSVATTGTSTGTYKIVVSGASSTTGTYTVQTTLNASLELEGRISGASNDMLATAQDLSSSFSNLTTPVSSAQRDAVLGQTDAAGGYTASAVTYAFQNIATTGTTINFTSNDNGSTLISPSRFTFPFYGTNYGSMYVSTNGLISFGTADTSFSNSDLTSSPSESVIAPFWDDLQVTGAADSKVVYQVLGSGSSAHMVIQWNNISFRADSRPRSGGLYFEAVLGADGSIAFNYQSLSTGRNNGTNDLGASATVGIKASGTQGSNRLLMYNNGLPTLINSGTSVLIAASVATSDNYSFAVTTAETDTLAVTNLSAGNVTVDLLNSSGTVLASGISGPTNLTKVINNFNIASAGTYYVRVSGDTYVTYSLVVTRGAAFDTEPNDSFAAAQSMDGTAGVLGYLTSSNNDWYSLMVNTTGLRVQLATSIPGGGSGEFGNTLTPMIELYDPLNNLVASGIVGSDGRNQTLSYIATTTGIYRARTFSLNGTQGEYFLSGQVAAQIDTIPPTSLISFPANGASYNAVSWTGTVSGTAADTGGSGINKVQVSIRRSTDSKYWGGTAFDQTSEFFLDAAGTTNWTLAFPSSNLVSDTSYTVHSVATDNVANVETSGFTATFSYDTAAPTSLISFPANGASYNAVSWTGTVSGTAADTGGSGINTVQVSIRRSTDSKYWGGTAFDQASEFFLDAAGTTNWTLAFPPSNLVSDTSYTVHSVATDNAANVETSGPVATFTYNPVAIVADWNSASNGPWNSAANWSDTQGLGVPGFSGITGDQATFNGATELSADLGNFSPSIAELTFGPSLLNYHIVSTGSGILKLNNGSSNATITVSAGSQTITAPIQLISNTAIYPAPSATLNISGSISSNTGTSLMMGDTEHSGTLVEAITGSVSVAGATNIAAGTLLVDGDWTTGVMNLTAPGGGQGSGQLSGSGTINLTSDDGLLYNSTAASTFAGNIKDSSSNARLVVNGGSLTLSGTNSYTGGTVVNAGTLIVTTSTALPYDMALTIGAGGTVIFDPSPAASNIVAAKMVASANSAGAITATTSDTTGNPPVWTSPIEATGAGIPSLVPPPTPVEDAALLQQVGQQAVDAIIAQQYVGDLAWRAVVASSSWSGNQGQKKDLALQALDLVLARFGV